jgi:hypothetical protein
MQGEREAEWLVVNADTNRHSRKTAGRAERIQNDHHEGRGMLIRWLPIADHVLSTRRQPSCATAHLLQARGERLSLVMMENVEMVL